MRFRAIFSQYGVVRILSNVKNGSRGHLPNGNFPCLCNKMCMKNVKILYRMLQKPSLPPSTSLRNIRMTQGQIILIFHQFY